MPFYERGPVRIHYEELGSGFPLLLIPGGGLNSALSSWQTASPFNPMERYKDDFRCICADLRNANPGQSSGPLEIDRPWDAYADDQLGLMDHLGILDLPRFRRHLGKVASASCVRRWSNTRAQR